MSPARIFFRTLLIAGPASTAIPASAQSLDDSLTVTATRNVHTRDLDLTTPQGRATLRHRVNVAAHEICTELVDRGTDTTMLDCAPAVFARAWPRATTLIAHANDATQVAAKPQSQGDQ